MDCPAIVHNMDTVRVDWEGIEYITSTTKAENQGTRYVEANYSREITGAAIYVDGIVSLTGRVFPYTTMRFRHSTTVPAGMVPFIYDEHLCYDPRTRKIVATYEAESTYGHTVELSISWEVDLFKQADLDRNGRVDGSDLGLLVSEWGAVGSFADIDGDGIVDGTDLGMLVLQYDI